MIMIYEFLKQGTIFDVFNFCKKSKLSYKGNLEILDLLNNLPFFIFN